MPVMTTHSYQVAELTTLPDWEELLEEVYRKIYLPAFPKDDERETPSDWLPRLAVRKPQPPQPLTHILLAGTQLTSRHARTVCAIAICEFYQHSCCALLTYIAVDPEHRGAGLARRLLREAAAAARADAEAQGRSLLAIFAEAMEGGESGAQPGNHFTNAARTNVLYRLGARLVPLDYVQPSLGAGKQRSRALKLLTLPVLGHPPVTLSRTVLFGYLEEFYAALGVSDPSSDADFLAMQESTGKGTELPLTCLVAEDPQLSFRSWGIAFHFIESPTRFENRKPGRSSEAFASFERDLLAFAFRQVPPFRHRRRRIPANKWRIEITFPSALEYLAEGERKRLVRHETQPPSARRIRHAFIKASESSFPDGTTVRHLVLGSCAPPGTVCDESFCLDEWDIVKLIKLWEGGEGTDQSGHRLASQILFRFEDSDEAMTIGDLARVVLRLGTSRVPDMGTIQLLTDDCDDSDEWTGVFEVLAKLEETGRLCIPPPLREKIKALGGIVQGLLDFPYVDAEELEDVLDKAQGSESSLIGVHKGTMFYFTEDCRAFRTVATTIGISPYLLIPHGLLAYNEELLRRAAQHSNVANAADIRQLARAEVEMRRALQKNYLPDVFHYPTEQLLYRTAHDSRGMTPQKEKLEERIIEIHTRLEEQRTQRQRRFETAITFFALLLSMVQVLSLIELFYPGILALTSK